MAARITTRMTISLLALLVLACPAAAQTASVRLTAPRPFGYFLGDVIRYDAEIVMDRRLRLDPASVPKPGPRAYWLDLRSVEVTETVEGEVRRCLLKFEHQTFYAPLEARKLEIPSISLSLTDGGERIQAQVPAWPFLASPMRETLPPKGEGWTYLRPDVRPRPVSTATEQAALAAAASTALLSLAGLAWSRAWPPFHRRRARPFAQAARRLQRAARSPVDDAAYLDALLTLHRAFDAAAGRRVLADDVSQFFRDHPAFERLKPGVERFYAASRRAFFGAQVAEAQALLPLTDAAALSVRLRALERRAE